MLDDWFFALSGFSTVNACVSFFRDFLSFESLEKNKKVIYRLKNCDLGLERPQSQFFAIQTSQLANNIYLLCIKYVL